MSVANAYLASRLNVGNAAGKHVQNVALTVTGRAITLLELMATLDAGVLLVGVGNDGTSLTSLLPAALKARYLSVEAGSALALQLGGLKDGLAIVRPDLHCAGNCSWADAPAMITRFRAELEQSSC